LKQKYYDRGGKGMLIFTVFSGFEDLSPRGKQWLTNALKHLNRVFFCGKTKFLSVYDGGMIQILNVTLTPRLQKSFKKLSTDDQEEILKAISRDGQSNVHVNVCASLRGGTVKDGEFHFYFT
jgi:hypothetical protein